MDKKRVVLDTNILVSSLGWKGNPYRIFKLILDGKFKLIMAKKQLQELSRVLDYPRLDFNEKQKCRLLSIIDKLAIIVETYDKVDVVKEDPPDNVILESAILNNVDFIVSGNIHLLKLKKFGKCRIVTASEFLRFYNSKDFTIFY